MATTTTPVKKVSWLKKVGQFLGHFLGILATEVKPVADTASKFAELLFPEYASAIGYADNLVTKIATEAVAVEGAAAAVGQAAGTGAQKLLTLVKNTGPAIDAWVQANFPGSKVISAATKAGLASAIVDVINEVEPASMVPAMLATVQPPPPVTVAATAPQAGPTLVSPGSTANAENPGDLGSNAPK